MIKTHQRRVAAADDDDPFGENGLLKDGRSFRVRMQMRDAGTVAGQIAADRQRVVDGHGDRGFGLQRPGIRQVSDASIYDATAAAYAAMISDSENAWQRGPSSTPLQDALPAATDTAPAWSPTISIADAQRIKDDAYNATVEDGQEAWRRLGSTS